MKRKLYIGDREIEYELERKSVRNINLRVRSDGSIYVSAPKGAPVILIEAFLRTKGDLILTALSRKKEHTGPGRLFVLGREFDDSFENDAQREKWLRSQCIEAVSEVFNRVYPSFERLGVPLPEIRFRKMKSRWGSCTPSKKLVTFNTALIHVPLECIELVVVHELCHFLRCDHSPAFHDCMTQLLPDWKARQKRLREFEGLLRE